MSDVEEVAEASGGSAGGGAGAGAGAGASDDAAAAPRADWWRRPAREADIADAFAAAAAAGALDGTDAEAARLRGATAAADPPDALFVTPLLPFQREALAWMLAQEANGDDGQPSAYGGGVLADESEGTRRPRACARRAASGAARPPLVTYHD